MTRSHSHVALSSALLVCLFCLPVHADKLPALDDVPAQLRKDVRADLTQQKTALEADLAKFQADAKAFNAKPAADQTDNDFESLEARRKKYFADVEAFNVRVGAERKAYTLIEGFVALAKKLKWSRSEQARLRTALESLDADGIVATNAEKKQVWKDVFARDSDPFVKEASAGSGPGFPAPAAGTQSFQDCAVFALANATGVPYEVVAARATKLIEEGTHRDASDRANAQKTIERVGLTGGEVVMLGEALGEVEVVSSTDFAKTLAGGRRLMINVSPGHEVVLSKSFQHDGETWYEMVDSSQNEWRRLYLSAAELAVVLEENGVAFRPDPKTKPRLLRKSSR
jgi:hypothetical protein